MKVFTKISLFSIGLMLCTLIAVARHLQDRPRLLISTDNGGEPDDIQSLRRFHVYANEFRLEGIIASASRNKKPSTPDVDAYRLNDSIIFKAVDDYGAVRDKLEEHSKVFPSAVALQRVRGKLPSPSRRELDRERYMSSWK